MTGRTAKSKEKAKSLSELTTLILTGEDRYHIGRMRRILTQMDPRQLAAYIIASDEYLFKSVLYYVQLFRTDAAMVRLFNDARFGLVALEKIVVYFHLNFAVQGLDPADMFSSCLPALDQDRYLALLTRSRHVAKDRSMCLNLLAMLDSDHLNQYITSREDPIQFLGELLLAFPEETIARILAANPDLYGYVRLFFQYGENTNEDVLALLERHESTIQEATQALVLARRYSEGGREHKEKKHDPVRIRQMVNEIKVLAHPMQAIEILAEKGAFRDDTEKRIITNILVNPHFRDILEAMPDLSVREVEDLGQSDVFFF